MQVSAFHSSARPEHRRSSRWPAARAAHLKREPICVACGGTDHLEVHHIEPFHLFPDKELDQDNLITLCEATGHHLWFGHHGNWSLFNPNVREDAVKARNP